LGRIKRIFKGVLVMHGDTHRKTDLEERIKTLEAGIQGLETRLDGLLKRLDRISKGSYEYDMLLDKHIKILDQQQKDAFERIINLEVKFFPNLIKDISRLHNIIGEGDNKICNPLDRREP
jgi:predicted  nucleic acid-binding Zn-ribbon protein